MHLDSIGAKHLTVCIVYSVSGSELTNGPAAAVAAAELHNGSQQADVSAAGGDGGAKMNGDVTIVECDSFCDFVRFEGTVTEQAVSSPGVAGNRLTGDDAGSGTLLRTCTEKYKLLFEVFVAAHILPYNLSLSASFMDWFVTSSCDKSEHEGQSRVRPVDRVELAGLTKNAVEAFSLSCQLLVDFSALPIYSESTVSSPTAVNNSGKKFFDMV